MNRASQLTRLGPLLVYTYLYFISLASCEDNSCAYHYEWIDQRKYYDYGYPYITFPDETFAIELGGGRCTINLTSINEKLLKRQQFFRTSALQVSILISCLKTTTVDAALADLYLPTPISLLYSISVVGKCSLSLQDLDVFASTGEIEIFSVGIDGSYIRNTDTEHECAFSKKLEMLSITNTDSVRDVNNTNTDSLNTILTHCKQPFSSLYFLELKFSEIVRMSAYALEIMFPNIKMLKMENVELNETLNFPWIKSLPEATSEDPITLPPLFVFSQTSVSNLQSVPRFILKGAIYVIQINGVSNESIEQMLLTNVTRLQKLDLSCNKLTRVFKSWFNNQSDIISLSISNNSICIIDNNTFDSMPKLEYLDLSNNKLSYIDLSLFDFSEGLREIHLEGNYIQNMPSEIFWKQRMALRAVFIHSNPLKDIPIVPFYAQNLLIYDLHNTSINDQSLARLGEATGIPDLIDGLRKKTFKNSYLNIDKYGCTKKIDLSHCNITHLISRAETPMAQSHLAILTQCTIILKDNPLHCGCDLDFVINTVNRFVNLWHLSKEQLYESWICNTPSELKGRNVLSITRHELLCPLNLSHCPHSCTCSICRDFSSLVVDCRNTLMTEIPYKMPQFDSDDIDLELLFRSSLIERVEYRDYFSYVTVLDLSNCRLNAVEPSAFSTFNNLKRLHMDGNLLSTLPEQMITVALTEVTLSNNPFLCDCRLLWMKQWLLQPDTPVVDGDGIKCTDGSEKGKQLIGVNDAMFVCRDESFNHLKHVVMPSLIIGSLSLAVVIIGVLVFFQSSKLKILLYAHCGIHPFDKDKNRTEACKYDAALIYSLKDSNFMQKYVVIVLKEKGYKIADMYKDFVIGKSFSANIEHLLNSSKRIILCVSTFPFENDLIQSAWTLAYEKTLQSQANFVILLLNNTVSRPTTYRSSSFYKFVKYGRYIKNDSRIFHKTLYYMMPELTDQNKVSNSTQELLDRLPLNSAQLDRKQRPTFITYPEKLHDAVKQKLIPKLQDNGHTVRIFEFEFSGGASKAEEIITHIERSRHLIYIMSEEMVGDEWKTVILKQAIVKTMSSNYNYLLLFTHGQIREELLIRTPEIRQYISNYATICTDHKDFMELLLLAMSDDLERI